MSVVVAVDGPSGSGKSTVSRRVASHFGLAYLDTGAMYRALTWWCLDRDIDLNDAAAVATAARDLPLVMGTDPAAPGVTVADTDVAALIREPGVSAVVSTVATNLDVRAELIARQRALIAGAPGGCVAEGRDITTVVAPHADVRLLLTASQDARLARRATELHGNADAGSIAATHDQIVRRDADDSTVAEFTTAADGVVTLDTSTMDLDQVVAAVVDLVTTSTGVQP